MNELLARVLDAHGGMDRWKTHQKVGATIVTGGGSQGRAAGCKPAPYDRLAARGTIVRNALWSSGSAMFTPERVAIEKLDGTLVAERYAPKDSFAGHQINTPWDPLHRAYFNGEALWTYLTTPFLLAMEGVRVTFPVQSRRTTLFRISSSGRT